jgi:hypothetical protein
MKYVNFWEQGNKSMSIGKNANFLLYSVPVKDAFGRGKTTDHVMFLKKLNIIFMQLLAYPKLPSSKLCV